MMITKRAQKAIAAAPPTTAAWDKLHSKLATISAAADIDKTLPPFAIKCPPNHV